MGSKRPAKTNHILHLAENKSGYDFIIGDLHGSLRPLREACEYLERAGDRLIIAGDLLDRGSDNPELIQFIQEYNDNNDKPGKIFSVCGNHELMILQTIAACENIFQQNPDALFAIDFSYIDDIRTYEMLCIAAEALIGTKTNYATPDEIEQVLLHCHPGNGGAWLINLFNDECNNELITTDANNNIIYHPDSKIKLIRDHICTLPIIIHVSGTYPFNVVHASMPVDDITLEKLIRDNHGLTDDEIEYAVWARPGSKDTPVVDVGRDRLAIMTFVGHTIIDETNIDECIDTETNTIYMDTASYFTGVSVVASPLQSSCMFTKSIEYILTNPDFEYLDSLVEQVESHLRAQRGLCIERCRDAKLHHAQMFHTLDTPTKQGYIPHASRHKRD